MRSNQYGLRVDLNPENMTIRFILRKKDGDTFDEVDSVTFSAEDIHPSLRGKVGLYGFKSLLMDRTSDIKPGPEKFQAMQEVVELLRAGKFEKERAIGAPTVSPEVEAIARIRGVTIPEIQAALRGYAPEARQKILAHPEVQRVAAQIRKEREASPEVSLDDLLA